jgi:hypothetical protein
MNISLSSSEYIVHGEVIKFNKIHDWRKIQKDFPNLDIYYSKEYVILFAEIQKGEPEAVYYEDEHGKVFYPFIKRKIDLMEGYFDIITPYGYGRPLMIGEKAVIREFYKKFNEYYLNNNIVTETAGLHPLLKNDEYIREVMSVDYIRKTAAVDLKPPLEEIRDHYSSNNKRNIKKANKERVEVFVSTNWDDMESFSELYYETMDRNNASKFYYFNKSYFLRQMEETEFSKSYLIFAKYQEQMIGGVLLIIGKDMPIIT